MSHRVEVVLICEDSQHEAFARRFLKRKLGTSIRTIRVEKGSSRGGAAEQFVRNRFPIEVRSYRTRAHSTGHAVLVLVDGDNRGLVQRIVEFNRECERNEIEPRREDERIAVFVPSWRIETWFAYLEGSDVDESRRDYPELCRASDCKKHVELLAKMCEAGELRQPAPDSLQAACKEFNSRIQA